MVAAGVLAEALSLAAHAACRNYRNKLGCSRRTTPAKSELQHIVFPYNFWQYAGFGGLAQVCRLRRGIV